MRIGARLATLSRRASTRTSARKFHTSIPRLGLLKGIDPLLTADLLHVLRSAGHGDEIAIVDCNFPAAQVATQTVTGTHIQLAGSDVAEALEAICSVFPLDYFVECPVHFMAPSEGAVLPPLGAEAHSQGKAVVQKHSPGVQIMPIERYEFYEAAEQTFAVIQCNAERRPYANFILKKGVVGPDGGDLKP